MPSSVMRTGYAHLLSLDKEIRLSRGERLSSASVTQEFKELHDWYVEEFRPVLREAAVDEQILASLDDEFEKVIIGASGRVRTTAGKTLAKQLRKLLEDAEKHVGTSSAGGASSKELEMISVLRPILPRTADSYEQALKDLAVERISYRGVASELREVLREVLDHLAPDASMPKTADGRRPTMKTKVRHILRAREMGDTRRSPAESTAEILDDGIPNLARSIYDVGSLETHVSPTRGDVMRLRGYLAVLLPDLLGVMH